MEGGQEVLGVSRITGPLVVIEGPTDAGYDEVVEVLDAQNRPRLGRVLEVGEQAAVIEVFAGTTGLSIERTRVRFQGRTFHLPVAREMLGRSFTGLGRPLDGGPAPLPERWADINGQPINPTARSYPREAIQTGIAAIDGLNTLILGQKLPIFSGNGLPHDMLAAQIARQARLTSTARQTDFAIVFGALGVSHDTAEYFRAEFRASGALTRVAMFLNLADDPPIERLITPRAALTLAEHLAFTHGMHVLVILTDMTNYCEALRQVSNIRGEVPSRKGYPGYLYSELAALYERSGRLRDGSGSLTLVPILTMPNDDITHPVPDLTGYITEGQIVLSRPLHRSGIYPPVDVLPSLSRLMKDGIGEGLTRDDHAHLAAQLYAAYARVQDVRALASVIGAEELPAVDQAYLRFGEAFEQRFVGQTPTENRSFAETLNLGWELLRLLPREELTRVTEAELAAHY